MTHQRASEDCERDLAAGGARHGSAVPRGQDALPGSRGGRFGRMFPLLAPCVTSDAAIDEIVADMRARPEPNHRIPAGYTYLGQFVDHDITFDPQSTLERANDPHALVNFRTPRFDLDSLYGSGPADQPFLYDWQCEPNPGVKLLVGHNPPGSDLAAVDLPRNEQDRALIGDSRNDEHLIVAQLHLLFIHFHNKIVDRISAQKHAPAQRDLLAEAQRIVRWHYQWIVVHDFLKRIVGATRYASLKDRADGSAADAARWLSAWRDAPAIPVEFSAAAYRFGHSMVRDGYSPKRSSDAIALFRRHGEEGLQWAGSQRLPCALEIEWDLFFFEQSDGGNPNRSLRIDTSISAPLFLLPPDDAQLPRLNLRRGRALGLPSGSDVARAMSVEPLTSAEVARVTHVPPATVARLQAMRETLPLWVYVLLEARIRGGDGLNLGPVGGGIVSEVLLGLLEADPSSYLRARPAWTPELSDREDGDFTMLDLVRYVQDPNWL